MNAARRARKRALLSHVAAGTYVPRPPAVRAPGVSGGFNDKTGSSFLQAYWSQRKPGDRVIARYERAESIDPSGMTSRVDRERQFGTERSRSLGETATTVEHRLGRTS